MKKTVKSLIVASSVAAIVGIGAVSFAAWTSGGGGGEQAAGGDTGNTVTALSGLSVEYGRPAGLAAAVEGQTDLKIIDKLVPYDQDLNGRPGQATLVAPGTGDAWQNVNYMVFTVSNGDDQAARANVTYKISGGLTLKETGSTAIGNAKLMYKVYTEEVTAAPASTAGFTTVPATPAAMKNFNSGDKVVVIMVANGNEAKNVNWNLTFSATDEVEADIAYKMTYGENSVDLTTVNPSEGESVVYLAENVTLAANTTLGFTIGGTEVTAIKGADDLDATKAGKATVTNNVVTVPAAGTYNIYIKQKTDDTTNWYVWVDYPAPTDRDDATVANKAFLVGQFKSAGDQQFYSEFGYTMTRDDTAKQWVISKDLEAGDVIKFRKNGAVGQESQWRGFGVTSSASTWFSQDTDGNLVVKEDKAGTYTFYLKDNPDGSIYVYVTYKAKTN